MSNNTDPLSQASSWITLFQFLVAVITGIISKLKLSAVGSTAVGALVFLGIFIFFHHFKGIRDRIAIAIFERWKYLCAPPKSRILKSQIAEYTYINRKTMSLHVSYSVKFTQGTHSCFVDRLKWTAGPVSEIKPIFSNQTIEMIPESQQTDIQSFVGYQYFKIQFQKDYTIKDGFIDAGYKIPALLDPEQKAKSCFIAGIYDKTSLLVLRVKFPAGMSIKNIRLLKYVDYLDEEPYYCKEGQLKVDGNDTSSCYVEFVVPHPIYKGKCAIDWDFE